MHSLYKLIRESGATIGTLSLILFLATISSLLAVLPPHFLGAAINSIIKTGSGNQEGMLSPIGFLNNWLNWSAASFNMPPIALFLLMFFLFNLIYMLVRNIFAVYVSIFTDKFILHVRRKCFARIFRGEKTDLERFDNGDMVHRVMSDTKQLDFIIGNPLYTLFSDVS